MNVTVFFGVFGVFGVFEYLMILHATYLHNLTGVLSNNISLLLLCLSLRGSRYNIIMENMMRSSTKRLYFSFYVK